MLTTKYRYRLHLHEMEISFKLMEFCLLQVQPILEYVAALKLNSELLNKQRKSISRVLHMELFHTAPGTG